MSWTRKIFLVGFFVASFLAALAIFSSTEVSELRKQKITAVQNIRGRQFGYVEGALSSYMIDANRFGLSLATGIKTDILDFYQKHPARSLSKDLDDLEQNDHPVINVIAKNFENKWLNGVQNDNNDPFAAMKDSGIIGDLSLNCSAFGRTRTFEQEYTLHAMPGLAETAVSRITNQVPTLAEQGRTDALIGWSFLKPKAPEYEVKDFSIESLRAVFLIHPTLDTFASYEFLVPQYIDPTQDMTGKPNVKPNGTRNVTKQLIIVAGFNLVDQINTNSVHRTNFEKYNDDVKTAEASFDSSILLKQLLSISLCILFIVCFLGTYIMEARLSKTENL